MKKNVIFILVFAIILLFASCSNTDSNAFENLPLIDVDCSEKVLAFYKAEHENFSYETNDFSNFKFKNYDSSLKTLINYNGEEYFYPVFVQDENSKEIILLAIDDSAYLYGFSSTESKIDNKFYGNVHYTIKNGEEIMAKLPLTCLVYNSIDHKITKWSFGKKIESIKIIKDASYVGYSEAELMYLFRSGTDVYGLKVLNPDINLSKFYPIAHNVKSVIDCSYCFSSDAWGQPLFLMENGDLKAYLDFESEDSSDSVSHLWDLMYEGSYDHHMYK